MPFFHRHVKATTGGSPTSLLPADLSESAKVGATGQTPGDWSEVALTAGQRARFAVERGDPRGAGVEWKALRDAEAKARGYDAADGFVIFNADVLRYAPQIREVAELDLAPERTQELRTALALDGVLYLKAADGVLATLLGRPLPRWKRFWDEREQWLKGSFRPEMWPPILLDGEPDVSWQPAELSRLSADARHILCYPKLIRSRSAVTRRFLAERTYLPSERLDRGLAELRAVGLAEVPSTADRLATLTVAQLKEAHARLGLPGKGTKVPLVSAFSSLDAEQVDRYLAQHHPSALAPEIAVGLAAGKAADWLIAYATLAAHWLTVGILPSIRQANDGGGGEWQILKTDSCPVCRKAPSRVPRSRPQELPPFHLGCRCTA